MVHEMYKQYAHPSVRIVQGLSTSWKPVVATVCQGGPINAVIWSPCNRLIAVSRYISVELYDSAVLNILDIFEALPPTQFTSLSFSPDSRFLTQFNMIDLVTWDIQTGGSVYATFPGDKYPLITSLSHTYSPDGEILAFLCLQKDPTNTFIAAHVLSTTCIHLHYISKPHIIPQIWTHGKFLQFATIESGHLTIWKVDFAFTHAPEMVKSFPVPDETINTLSFEQSLLLPAPLRLAIALKHELFIWDPQNSKFLLQEPLFSAMDMSFSSSGHFFASMTPVIPNKICVWKESHAGYILHQRIEFDPPEENKGHQLSPNGESTVVFVGYAVHLWHTRDEILSGSPVQTEWDYYHILSFSPNETLVAFSHISGEKVKILDLKSGDLQLELDTCDSIECLGVTESAISVFDYQRNVTTWNLAAGKTRMNICDGTQVARINCASSPVERSSSMSPDLKHVVILEAGNQFGFADLKIYDTSTGKSIAGATVRCDPRKGLWFSLDGREIWGITETESSLSGWRITESETTNTVELQELRTTSCPTGLNSRRSPHGYEITPDWWILSPTGELLLWLPHNWRPNREEDMTWSKRFLALHSGKMVDPVIIEFLC